MTALLEPIERCAGQVRTRVSAPTPTDHDLLHQIAAGDATALSILYDRFAPRVLGLLSGFFRSRADAEDTLQEAFWTIWRTAGTYNPALCSPAGWIMMVARSRALDRVRKLGRDRLIGGDSVDDLLPRLDHTPEALPVHEPGYDTHSALDLLPDEQRQAVVLAFYRGLSREEIARVQGVPVGTVKTRIRSGVRRLRDILEDQQAHLADGGVA